MNWSALASLHLFSDSFYVLVSFCFLLESVKDSLSLIVDTGGETSELEGVHG